MTNSGWSLTVGDFNDDGCDDLAIGVPYEAIGNLAIAGAVNVLYGSFSSGLSPSIVLDQIWHQDTRGMPTTAAAGTGFGTPSSPATSTATATRTWPSAFRARTSTTH